MNGKYTDLDPDHKKELLVNLNALFLASFNLAEVMNVDFEAVTTELWEKAYSQVSSLSDAEVERSIVALEKKHRPFKQPGEAVVQKFERDNNGG